MSNKNLQTQIDFIKDRAFLIMGASVTERDPQDPRALSGIDDATRFLRSLPADCSEPWISGGITTNPEPILTFNWLLPGSGKTGNNIDHYVVTIYGYGRWSVGCDKNGKRITRTGNSIEDLLTLNVGREIKLGKKGHASKCYKKYKL
ncbi:hypothetical protein AB6B38_07505 [Glycocaulis abyssi]|uniref:Uncharacterized protein n=1 Tax=Glycocaulis abyssi TaxID=1433403 RepID=A0ABV9NIQ2_9PROT